MPNIADHLSILGLDSCDSESQLKEAYRSEMKKWHPDFFQDDKVMYAKATERAKLINAAFEYFSELIELGDLVGLRSQQPPKSNRYQTRHAYRQKPFKPGFPAASVVEVFIKSSHIISYGYERGSQTLYLKFEGDIVYSYENVPESVVSEFADAASHGRFAHRYIYYKFNSKRL